MLAEAPAWAVCLRLNSGAPSSCQLVFCHSIISEELVLRMAGERARKQSGRRKKGNGHKGIMANAITCIRIVCALCLVFCPTFSGWFFLFYVVGGISDVLDGMVARRLGTESTRGARLDTVADFAFLFVVLVKVLRAVPLPFWLIIWVICIAIIKCVNIVSGFIVTGHLISVHSVVNKVCGVLIFAIPMYVVQVPWRLAGILIILTCAATTFAALQEGYFIRAGKEIC